MPDPSLLQSARLVIIENGQERVVMESDTGSELTRLLHEFCIRGDCTLVWVLSDGTEIGINPEAGRCLVAISGRADPQISELLQDSYRPWVSQSAGSIG